MGCDNGNLRRDAGLARTQPTNWKEWAVISRVLDVAKDAIPAGVETNEKEI
jgi:hypothetical protein